MSAFLVSSSHIDALVGVAVQGPRRDRSRPWEPLRYFWDGRWYEVTAETADQTGRMLWTQNQVSVNARYSITSEINQAEREVIEAYTFTNSRRPNFIESLKALSCFEYQACEDPAWFITEARAFCEALQARVIVAMPGYDAAPWHWSGTAVELPEVVR